MHHPPPKSTTMLAHVVSLHMQTPTIKDCIMFNKRTHTYTTEEVYNLSRCIDISQSSAYFSSSQKKLFYSSTTEECMAFFLFHLSSRSFFLFDCLPVSSPALLVLLISFVFLVSMSGYRHTQTSPRTQSESDMSRNTQTTIPISVFASRFDHENAHRFRKN